MTREEARLVVVILLGADGGCGTCAAELVERFVQRWPRFEKEAREEFRKEYEREYDAK